MFSLSAAFDRLGFDSVPSCPPSVTIMIRHAKLRQ
jgi:hypothetical protein